MKTETDASRFLSTLRPKEREILKKRLETRPLPLLRHTPTGIPVLDAVLGGGLTRPGFVLVQDLCWPRDSERACSDSLLMILAANLHANTIYTTSSTVREVRGAARRLKLQTFPDVIVQHALELDKAVPLVCRTDRKFWIIDDLNSFGSEPKVDILAKLRKVADGGKRSIVLVWHGSPGFEKTPMALELTHSVDTVITLRASNAIQILCTEKNRFPMSAHSALWVPA